MKHIGNELYRIIAEKKLVKRQIANAIGIDPSQFSQMMHKSSFDSEILERICNELNIFPGVFFDGWPEGKYNVSELDESSSSSDKSKIIEALNHQLEDKERLIEEKERLIKLLSEKLNIHI